MSPRTYELTLRLLTESLNLQLIPASDGEFTAFPRTSRNPDPGFFLTISPTDTGVTATVQRRRFWQIEILVRLMIAVNLVGVIAFIAAGVAIQAAFQDDSFLRAALGSGGLCPVIWVAVTVLRWKRELSDVDEIVDRMGPSRLGTSVLGRGYKLRPLVLALFVVWYILSVVALVLAAAAYMSPRLRPFALTSIALPLVFGLGFSSAGLVSPSFAQSIIAPGGNVRALHDTLRLAGVIFGLMLLVVTGWTLAQLV